MSTYSRRTFDVEAIQLKRRTALDDGQTGDPGDWLVTYPSGRQKIMKDKAFRAEFVKKVSIPEQPRRDPMSWPWPPKYFLRDEATPNRISDTPIETVENGDYEFKPLKEPVDPMACINEQPEGAE